MKEWIKFETDIMQHDAVRKMYADEKLRGIGVYVIIRLYIRRMTDSGLPYHEVLHYGNNYASRNLVRRVLEDYGLFDLRNGMVKPLPLCVGASAGASVEAGAEASVDTSADTPVPTSEENRKEESYLTKTKTKTGTEMSEEEVEWQKEFHEHYPTVSSMSKPLTLAEYNKLLQKYSNDAIKDKLERMENYPNLTKRYTSTYLTLNNWLKS